MLSIGGVINVSIDWLHSHSYNPDLNKTQKVSTYDITGLLLSEWKLNNLGQTGQK